MKYQPANTKAPKRRGGMILRATPLAFPDPVDLGVMDSVAVSLMNALLGVL